MAQGNIFLFEFGLTVLAVLDVYFDIICNQLQKSYPYLLIFAPIKNFLHVGNVKYRSKHTILKNFRNTESFLSF